MRRQLGNMRADLQTLVDQKPKAERKAAKAAVTAFWKQIEDVDFQIQRTHDIAAGQASLTKALALLDAAVAGL